MNFLKRLKKVNIAKHLFGAIVLLMVIYLLVGTMLNKRESMPFGYSYEFGSKADWVQILADEEQVPLEDLEHIRDHTGMKLILETKLPDKISSGSCISMRATEQNLWVFVDGKLRTLYLTQKDTIFGSAKNSAYVFVPLEETDAGANLRIVLDNNGVFRNRVSRIYLGRETAILYRYWQQFRNTVYLAAFLFFFSLLILGLSLILWKKYRLRPAFGSLGIAYFNVALYLISGSMVRQLIIDNESLGIAVFIGSSLTIAVPFLFYVEELLGSENITAFRTLEFAEVFASLSSFALMILGIMNTELCFYVGMTELLATMIFAFYMFWTEGDSSKSKANRLQIIAMMVVFPFLIIGMFWTYLQYEYDMNIGLCLALLVLLCLNVYIEMQETMKLREKTISAENLSRAKSSFLANMSHEIRTPINSIMGMNEMILRDSESQSVHSYAQNIKSASDILLSLVNDILDFSKIESGRMELIYAEYSTLEMLQELVQILKERSAPKNLYVDLRISPDLPAELYGDEAHIKQLVLNVIINAIKYTGVGMILFEVKPIWEENEFSLGIVVQDTGIGMREEELAKIFTQFNKAEERRNASVNGAGLGLCITKSLLDKMGGTISIESTVGKGTTVTMRIPQKLMNQSLMGPFEERIVAAAKKAEVTFRESFIAPEAKILVVDDNLMNRNVAKALLRKFQVQVDLADGGVQALAMCEENQYHLILMDHMMPDKDGIETLHELRDGNSLNKDTCAVVVTANAVAGMREMYLSEGFADYMTKPINPKLLCENLQLYLPQELIQ